MKQAGSDLVSGVKRRCADIVSALVYAAVRDPSGSQSPATRNRITTFVVAQQDRMPDFLRRPLRLLTVLFDFSGAFLFQRFFRHQSAAQRSAQAAWWRHALLAPCRDLMRFYDSLITLASLDEDLPHAVQPAASVTGAPAIIQRAGCEVAVIGSGPGGAIAGAIWAEAGAKVSMFEEGAHLPLESCRPFSVAEMVQKYRNGGLTPTFGRLKVPYVEAACVGGGSEVNSGLYHRTPPEILAKWAREFGLEASSPDALLPHFEACERAVSVSPLAGPPPLASRKLQQGAEALGWSCQEVPRWIRYASPSTSGTPVAGERQSMSRTFIPRFLAAGGSLISDARVHRLRRDGALWQVSVRHRDGHLSTVSAEKVVLAAGAIGTPALLQRSSLGINVGESLQMHPTIKVVALFDEEVNTPGMGVPVHQVKEFAPRFSFGCSISTKPYLALAMLDHPDHVHLVETHWTRMAIYYAMIVPEGVGSIRTLPGFNDPLVRYSITPGDLRTLGEALGKLSKLLFAAGARTLFPSIAGQAPLQARDALSSLPTTIPKDRANLMTIHLFSSCPMGEDQHRCATDSFGRLHGEKGIFVSDGSLLPTAPGVNPQGSIMAFAHRNARHLSGRLGSSSENSLLTH